MKKLCLLFILVPYLCLSQTDSLRRKKIGWQFSFPFEPGLSYYLPERNKGRPEFAHLLNNRELIGTHMQIGSFQLQFYDRFFIEAAADFDNIGFKEGGALKELQDLNPDYFIQARSEYGEPEGAADGRYASSIRCFRLGAGYNILLKQYLYLKPSAAFNAGYAALPSTKYVFKEYTSNNFFTNTYSYGKLKSSGFTVGICFSRYMPSDNINIIPLWGIKLDYSRMIVKGEGKITQTRLYQPDVESFVPVNDKFQYITLSIFLGLSGKRDKR